MFLPCYALPPEFPFLPASLDWTREWWTPGIGGAQLRLYYDGSRIRNDQGSSAGAAVAAFVHTDQGWQFAGALSTQLPAEFSSYNAELAAAIIAHKLAFDLAKLLCLTQPLCAIEFCYDSLSVGKQAEGIWQAESATVHGHLLRSLHRCLEARFGCPPWHTHVRAHEGEPGNELVDCLAHQAALGKPLHDLASWLDFVTRRDFVGFAEWWWFLFRQDVSWKGTHLLLPAAPTSCPCDVDQLSAVPAPRKGTQDSGFGTLQLRLATCNVLSLMPGREELVTQGLNGPARLDSLLAQLHESSTNVFAFQETRLRRMNHSHDSRFWLYKSSATKHGHYGILVGLARTLPIGSITDSHGHTQDVFIQQNDVAVVSAEPRHLILRVKTSICKCILVAGHAPHSGATSDEIAQWWRDLAATIPCKYKTWQRILLVDANARVGNEPCQQIGGHQAEGSNGKADSFEYFVREQGLFLPSTFAHFQEGDGMTWRHANGSWHRNDFIGLPMSWSYASCRAWVSLDVDVGLAKEDHRVPMVQFTCSMPVLSQSGPRRPFKLNIPSVEPEVVAALPRPDWLCDVHTHARQLQTSLVDALAGSSVDLPGRPQKVTMSADTWDLVCMKRAKRSELAEFNQAQRHTALAAWFACWRHAMVEIVHLPLMAAFDGLLMQLDRQIAFAYFQFRCLGRKVVAALRADDASFYSALLHDAAEYLSPTKAKQFWAVVRRSLPKFQQRRMTVPPFQVEGLEDQWASHFGDLEVGVVTTPCELIWKCWTRQSRWLFTAPEQICLTDLPSVIQLEDAFRMTTAGKATGDDPIPSALFHHSAASLAHLYHDLLLKEFVWQTEPLDCKGGPIAIIPKCLSPCTAKQYRGILLLGNMAKRTHAVLRQQIMKHLSAARAPGQLGGFRGQQVCFGSQALRLFSRLADQRGVSSAILFLDLASAFHHLVRELVTGVSSSTNLEQLLHELRKAGTCGDKVSAAAGLPGILAELGAPECLIRLVRDIHAETWCSLPNG